MTGATWGWSLRGDRVILWCSPRPGLGGQASAVFLLPSAAHGRTAAKKGQLHVLPWRHPSPTCVLQHLRANGPAYVIYIVVTKRCCRRGKPPAADAADAASTKSDDLESRDAGRASSACGNGKGRGRSTKFDALVSSPPEQRGNWKCLLKTPGIDLPRNLGIWARFCKKKKVGSIVTGPCVILSNIRSFWIILGNTRLDSCCRHDRSHPSFQGHPQQQFHKQYSNAHPVREPLFPCLTAAHAGTSLASDERNHFNLTVLYLR